MIVEKLSASKVDTFYSCKRLFKYQYVKPPFPPPRKRVFVIGNIAHKALELLHKTLIEPGTHSCKDVMSKAFKSAAKQYSVEAKALGMKKPDVLEIKSMLQAYLDELVQDNLPDVLHIEKYFKIKLDNIVIAGKADRVDRLGDALKVVDYKTSQTPLTTEEAFESVQLPTYALWLKHGEKFGGRIIGEYVYLRHLGTKRARKTFTITKEHVADAVEKYHKVRWELDHNCKFIRNTRFKWCKYCEYRDFCMGGKDD